ncbi:ubiquitin-conjugating enzyme E2-16 kDa [Apiospora hydei]|uniref:Ubiquitin-conjugating enzyme E2-16 kDa n=1 Tax=Apiospora hydei TaxID=1337664 RepID=A0ABR1VJS7_9PEZI
MAEVAGLALGVLGIAGLFTSCIENFDIVVRAKDFGDDFDHFCTRLSLERVRLALWGETLGLMPSWPDQKPQVPYNHAIDREDIQPSIVACLCQLLDLLTRADVITERYALDCTPLSTQAYSQEVTQTPRGMLVLRDSFQKFKERIRKNQKQKSVWKVTRWSIHDCAQFEALVDKVHKLLDGLESITNALGVLERQRERLLEEVDSESDAQSLSLLQDIGSSKSAPVVLRAVSETASIRLTILSGDSQSYFTAKTGQTGSNRRALSLRKKELISRASWEGDPSINQSEDAVVVGDVQMEEQQIDRLSISETPHVSPEYESSDLHDSVPQQQRWISALLASRPDVKHTPVFSPSDSHYGQAIDLFRASDEHKYGKISGLLANSGNIHRAAIPFISAVPIDDALDKILACIEGPPGTPYQGGIFWITVWIEEFQPPAMRFHTRIYHPNIDHTGKICADYAGWWQSAKMLNKDTGRSSLRHNLPWFSEHATNQYSLGALLVALCGLLASPNIEDPLVPEIAEKYVTDYDGYCSAARLYTHRYAGSSRPSEKDLSFSHPSHPTEDSPSCEAPDFDESKTKKVTSSIGCKYIEGSMHAVKAWVANGWDGLFKFCLSSLILPQPYQMLELIARALETPSMLRGASENSKKAYKASL